MSSLLSFFFTFLVFTFFEWVFGFVFLVIILLFILFGL